MTIKNATISQSCTFSGLPVLTGATVTGNLTYLENGSSESFSFVDLGNGNYTYEYTFSNGTYNLTVNASKSGIQSDSDIFDFEIGNIITGFSINPIDPYKDVTTFFTTLANNSDNMENLYINTTEIWFYTDTGTFVESIYLSGLSNHTLAPGDNITHVYSRTFVSYTAGIYVAKIILNYTYQGKQNTTTTNQSFTVRDRPSGPPPGGGGGGGGGGGSAPPGPPSPPPGVELEFKKHPILRETTPKGLIIADMVVKNPTAQEVIATVTVGGAPGQVKKITELGTISPNETKVETFSIEVPENASAGDYLINVDVTSTAGSGTSYFVLRVIKFPQAYVAPQVFRTVDADYAANISSVKISLKNNDIFRKNVYIYETIPKSVAKTTRDINFSTYPTRIINDEPVVLWVLQDVQPQQRQDLAYDVKGITGEYEPYIYYLSEEVVAISVRTEEWIKIINVFVSPMSAGEDNNYVTIELENTYSNPLDVEVSLFTIEQWVVRPEEMHITFGAREKKEVRFDVVVPSDTQQGTYAGIIFLRYQNITVSKDIVIGVGVGIIGTGVGWEVIVIITVLFIIGVILSYLLSRRVYKKEVKKYIIREDRFKLLNDIKGLIKKW